MASRCILTGKEHGILELLSLYKDATMTKEMILSHLYRGMDEPDLKIIDVSFANCARNCPGDRR
jgi:two-component system cell cycle response regulator CtrA